MFDILLPLVQDAGRLALQHFGRLPEGDIAQKGHLDLVTVADRAVEALLIDGLRRAFPEDGILGEEGGDHLGTSGRVWVIDPIDGTFNFVRGGVQWAVSVGLFAGGRPVLGIVHAPAAGLMLTGGIDHAPELNGQPLPPLAPFAPARGVIGLSLSARMPLETRLAFLGRAMDEAGVMLRICNASTWSLIELARGEVDGHVGLGEQAWDVMGMLPIVTALGATGTPPWPDDRLGARIYHVVGKPGLVAQMAPLVAAATPRAGG
jgi:myo-inositol-1(or 4)-monophosphatase